MKHQGRWIALGGILAILAAAIVAAVSYTHLDVYKRQPLELGVALFAGQSGVYLGISAIHDDLRGVVRVFIKADADILRRGSQRLARTAPCLEFIDSRAVCVGTSLAGIIRDQLVIAGGDGFVQHDLHHVFRIPGDFDLLGPVGAVVAGQDAEVAGDIARSFAAGIDERELVDGPAVAFAEIDLQVNTILAVAPLLSLIHISGPRIELL